MAPAPSASDVPASSSSDSSVKSLSTLALEGESSTAIGISTSSSAANGSRSWEVAFAFPFLPTPLARPWPCELDPCCEPLTGDSGMLQSVLALVSTLVFLMGVSGTRVCSGSENLRLIAAGGLDVPAVDDADVTEPVEISYEQE